MLRVCGHPFTCNIDLQLWKTIGRKDMLVSLFSSWWQALTVGAHGSESTPPRLEVREVRPIPAASRRLTRGLIEGVATYKISWPRLCLLGVWGIKMAQNVKPFHLDLRWESSGLSLLLQGDAVRFDPGSGCPEDTWPKVRLLSVLPKQTEYLTQGIFRDWRGDCSVCSLGHVKAVFSHLPLFLY